MTKIYLATPYSHWCPLVRWLRFWRVTRMAVKLMKDNYIVYSPITHTHPMDVICGIHEPWEHWEKYDTPFVIWADWLVVYRQRGWEKSVGVAAEIAIAKKLGKPVKYI